MARMTIDEVIAHCERTIKNTELIMQKIPDDNKYYWEHKQTAEWLRELKRYKDLEESGRLVVLPSGVTGKQLCKIVNACPSILGLKNNCGSHSCESCWEAALKGAE